MDRALVRCGATLALGAAVLVAACGADSPAPAKPAAAPAKPAAAPAKSAAVKPADPAATGIAIFAGGCFWCLETAFEGVPGVQSVVSGYTGGHKDNPKYEEVSMGGTGHAEAVEIRFDPGRVTYAQLLDRFWHSVDPTQGNGQFCDLGNQYRSEIYWRDEAQRSLAEESKRRLAASGVLRKPIVTRIVRATRFYPAEEYHQDYWRKDPVNYHSYREGCGRDRRLAELWGKDAVKPLEH